MKKLLIMALAAISVISCNNKNSKMTELIKQKKVLQDSMQYYHGTELLFNDSSHRVAHSTHDSTIYLPLADSESKYWNLNRLATNRLKDIEFSIDSLEKMK